MRIITFDLCTLHYRVYDADPHEEGWQDLIHVLGKYATLGYTQVILRTDGKTRCDQC
jgi:hypothetical protein